MPVPLLLSQGTNRDYIQQKKLKQMDTATEQGHCTRRESYLLALTKQIVARVSSVVGPLRLWLRRQTSSGFVGVAAVCATGRAGEDRCSLA